MTHAEKARELFLSGCSCSQAVLGAFAEELGLDNDTAMKLASSRQTVVVCSPVNASISWRVRA